jgi:glycosyltransferase involved in cell wall biosynthesis
VAALARVLVISFSDLSSDPRVDRQIAALRVRHDVTAAGLAPPAYADVEFVDITTPRLGLVDGGVGVARLLIHRFEAAYWRHPKNREVLRRLRGVAADVVLANDLPALPVASSLGAPVVLDAHEFAPAEYSDRLWWRALIAPYVDWECRRYLPQVAAMTTVGESISDAYERAYGVRAAVVTNAPSYVDLRPSPMDAPIRILHHAAAQPGRGLEEMLRVANLLDDRFTVDFVLAGGSSRFRDGLVAQASDNLRVSFLPPVPMRELVQMANGYDVGLYLLPPTNLNQRFALPNKFFEFIQARLAVAIGPSPEMAGLVRRYGCGVVAADFTPEALAAELNSLDASRIAELKQASDVAAAELSAERNADVILSAIDTALAVPVHAGSDAA